MKIDDSRGDSLSCITFQSSNHQHHKFLKLFPSPCVELSGRSDAVSAAPAPPLFPAHGRPRENAHIEDPPCKLQAYLRRWAFCWSL